MIDIVLYRNRIGTFQQRLKIRKSDQAFKNAAKVKNCQNPNPMFFVKLLALILVLGDLSLASGFSYTNKNQVLYQYQRPSQPEPVKMENILQYVYYPKKARGNFYARYTYGNRGVRSKGLKNMHLNIRSLGNKMSEIKNLIREHKPHVFGLSETEIKRNQNHFNEDKLKIQGYDLLFPKSWASKGYARVLVYVKASLEYEQIHEIEDEKVQSIWVRGGFKNGAKAYYCHVYREHTSTLGNSLQSQRILLDQFLLQWDKVSDIGNGDQPNEIHISGDFNLDSMNGRWLDNSYHLVSLARMVQAACNLGNFSQLVTAPTRFQFNRVSGLTDSSCIDHIYTNYKYRCSDITIVPFGGSDHDMVVYTRFSKDPPAPSRTIRRRSYKTFLAENFLEDLSQVDWGEVYLCQDLDLAVDTFTRIFREVLDKHAPWVVFQQRKKFTPWVSDETVKLIKERDNAKKAAVELATSGYDSSTAWAEYRALRNTINNRLKHEEKRFKEEKIRESLGSSAETWKTAKMFMNWNSSAGPPSQLTVGGKLITKAANIASEMNEFFIQKVKLIRDGIGYVPNNLSKCLASMQGKRCSLRLTQVSVGKVNKLLKGLKNSRSTSVDGLDNFCIKISADIIAPVLHHIITLSVNQNRFPESWKYSKVIPLHKKGSKLERKNYRPVAILSPLSKIMEKIVYEQIYQYFSRNKLFHPNLHGYRENRSTQTALLAMYDKWVRAASKGQVSGVILLDLSAAFDLVDPDLLIRKLKIYGIEEAFASWISSYLTNRYQAVWIDHVYSDYLHCGVGVPQGSNLGPLFFIIFFNDLPYHLEGSADSYADDTTLTATGASIQEISEKLTVDCEAVSDWMKANKLKLNPDKTHILTVGTQQRLNILDDTVTVEMDNVLLTESASKTELLLGCHINANLKWQQQVKFLIVKLRTRLVALTHLKFICNFQTKKSITEGLFDSAMVYCLPVFGGLDKGDIRDIQVLQNKAARLVCKAPPRANRAELYQRLGWLSVNQQICYHTLITVYKIRKSSEPEYLANFLNNVNMTGKIIIPNPHLTITQRSFVFRGSTLWNQLPQNIRNCQKIGAFKKAVKPWILQTVSQFLD